MLEIDTWCEHHIWTAQVHGNPELWAVGGTSEEAIGQLVILLSTQTKLVKIHHRP
jgi:hypothetical protein